MTAYTHRQGNMTMRTHTKYMHHLTIVKCKNGNSSVNKIRWFPCNREGLSSSRSRLNPNGQRQAKIYYLQPEVSTIEARIIGLTDKGVTASYSSRLPFSPSLCSSPPSNFFYPSLKTNLKVNFLLGLEELSASVQWRLIRARNESKQVGFNWSIEHNNEHVTLDRQFDAIFTPILLSAEDSTSGCILRAVVSTLK